jgi:tetratricopeptide (TPR) repeat protein
VQRNQVVPNCRRTHAEFATNIKVRESRQSRCGSDKIVMDKITLLESAVQASKRGNLAESIALLEQYAKHEDTDPRIMAWLGSLYEEKGEHLAAIAAFERALALDDSSATAQSGLAQALYSVGRLSDAILAMRKALDRAATAPRYILLGVMQRELGHDAEAEQSFRAALVLETGNDEALLNLALLIRPERPDEALALLRRAVQIDPANAAASRELGLSLLRQERGSIESERALRTAMMLDPRGCVDACVLRTCGLRPGEDGRCGGALCQGKRAGSCLERTALASGLRS